VKVFRVHSCHDCPYCLTYNGEQWCDNNSGKMRGIVTEHYRKRTIPDWCPMENYEDVAIKVHHCGECPYAGYDFRNSTQWCTKMEDCREIVYEYEEKLLPEWCPLFGIKAKPIKVDSCCKCQFCGYDPVGAQHWCTKTKEGKDVNKYHMLGTKPDWCPLKDENNE